MQNKAQTKPCGQVFISYSRKDEVWLEKLRTMLKPLIHKNDISVWDDTQIIAGTIRQTEINKALTTANIAILLVSSNFLNSDSITSHQLPSLLKVSEQKGLKIIWIYLSACLYEETEIINYQAAHNLAYPLNCLTEAEQEQVLLSICKQIGQIVKSSREIESKTVSVTGALENLRPSPKYSSIKSFSNKENNHQTFVESFSFDVLKVQFPNAVPCKISYQTRKAQIGRIELKNTGNKVIPAGWRGKIGLLRSIDFRITLIDTIILPAFPIGTVVPIGPFNSTIPQDIANSQDKWHLEFYILDPHGMETLLFRSSSISFV